VTGVFKEETIVGHNEKRSRFSWLVLFGKTGFFDRLGSLIVFSIHCQNFFFWKLTFFRGKEGSIILRKNLKIRPFSNEKILALKSSFSPEAILFEISVESYIVIHARAVEA
jgi:hypothetical protein